MAGEAARLTVKALALPFLAALALAALVGGFAVKVFRSRKEEVAAVRGALRAAAEARGLDPDIPDAIGYVETKWTLAGRSTDPRDEALGGSYGPTQISERTARLNGYTGDMEELRRNPQVAAELTAQLLVAGARNAQGAVLALTPQTIEDAAAWWNAGRQSAAALPEGHVTLREYIPAALAALDLVQSEPLA